MKKYLIIFIFLLNCCVSLKKYNEVEESLEYYTKLYYETKNKETFEEHDLIAKYKLYNRLFSDCIVVTVSGFYSNPKNKNYNFSRDTKINKKLLGMNFYETCDNIFTKDNESFVKRYIEIHGLHYQDLKYQASFFED